MNIENYYKNKHVLVAGGAGFVAVNLMKSLVKYGAHITSTLHKKNAVIIDNNINYIWCDLENEKDCLKVLENIDYVFMCAANTSGSAIIQKDPLVHLTPNIIMNLRMLSASKCRNVKKFLFISSNIVYPESNKSVQENDVNCEFFEKYYIAAWMKYFSEIACDIYSRKISDPLKTIVVRPGNLYGEYDDFDRETSHVIPALIRKIVERLNPLEVWGDGNDLKDFLYIGDFVHGMLLAMQKMDNCEPVNIASGVSYSIREILDYIIEIEGYTEVEVVYNNLKPTMIPKRLINIDKARDILGFQAKCSIKEGLQNTIKWYKEN